MTERFDRNGNVVISDGTHGFPLSAVFNRHKAHLGEHAKMTACQSPERWIKYQKETEDAIHGHYFRALLHVSCHPPMGGRVCAFPWEMKGGNSVEVHTKQVLSMVF